MHIQYN